MNVLIVDDERNIRQSLTKYLMLEGIEACGAESAEEALSLLEKESFDAMVLDLKLPGISGQELLGLIERRGLGIQVIMISAHGEIPDAVAALKSGAKDYLVKPFDPAGLVIKLRSIVENKRRENLVEAERRTEDDCGLIAVSPPMLRVVTQIKKIAAAGATVLITGESGAGKEVAAREIHRRGGYAGEPFAAVNIGGIHEGLMESELFGHEKGAFTGAVSRKSGLFELAGKGSLFLDEVGEMPLALQVKLLRVLQERKIQRLGGSAGIPVNARIISATNRNIEKLVKEGRFREDLYYRLNVCRIELPPLRERTDDIGPLSEALIEKLARRMGRPAPFLTAAALERLKRYSFPGNIRELENILERALIYHDDPSIQAGNLDLRESGASGAPSSLDSIEREAVRQALEQCGGNRTQAAALLGITRKTILSKIKKFTLAGS